MVASLAILGTLIVSFICVSSFSLKNSWKPLGRSFRRFCSSSDYENILSNTQDQLLAEFPNHNDLYTSISFYHFAKEKIHDLDTLLEETLNSLASVDVKGSIYLAEEGINGQMAIRTTELMNFYKQFSGISDIMSTIRYNIGNTTDYSSTDLRFPFKKLAVKVKSKILTDGLADEDIDWTDAGPELSSEEWHNEISKEDVVLLDCRNDYESDMGTFEGAVPLNTSVFSESWDIIEDVLKDIPPTAKVLTFCTGGIRCVKVNAYLKQKLGRDNVGRLKNGIIAYEKWIEDTNEDNAKVSNDDDDIGGGHDDDYDDGDDGDVEMVESKFKGENFLFDRRRLAKDDEMFVP